MVRKPSRFAFALGAAALLECAADLYPKAPSRTAPGAMAGRMLSGAGCGWIVASSRGDAPGIGVVLGAAGALAGAYGGLAVRLRTAASLGPVPAAILEDLVAIGAALTIVERL